MIATEGTATVLGMDAQLGRGAAIKLRREAMGWDALALAERAGMNRGTLAKVESDLPSVRPATYAKVERALDELDEALGEGGTRMGTVVTMRGVYGVDELVYQSSSQDPEVVAEALGKLVLELKKHARE